MSLFVRVPYYNLTRDPNFENYPFVDGGLGERGGEVETGRARCTVMENVLP